MTQAALPLISTWRFHTKRPVMLRLDNAKAFYNMLLLSAIAAIKPVLCLQVKAHAGLGPHHVLQAYGHTMDFTRLVLLLRASWDAPEASQPNLVTYNAAISACCRVGQSGRAMRLLHEMVRWFCSSPFTTEECILMQQCTAAAAAPGCYWQSSGVLAL